MPRSIPVPQWDPELVDLVEQVRAAHPGLTVDVQSPTAEERDDLAVAGDYRELVIGRSGLERYVIPLRDDIPLREDVTLLGGNGFEVWRVGMADMPGVGDLLGSHPTLDTAVDAAVAAASEPPEDPEPAVESRGPGSDPSGRLREQTAVSNVWRSDMTAAAELQAQVRAAQVDGATVSRPLREEEVDLLDLVDPDPVRAIRQQGGRQVGGRMDWTHRRPERAAAQPAPGRQLGRSVDGSD